MDRVGDLPRVTGAKPICRNDPLSQSIYRPVVQERLDAARWPGLVIADVNLVGGTRHPLGLGGNAAARQTMRAENACIRRTGRASVAEGLPLLGPAADRAPIGIAWLTSHPLWRMPLVPHGVLVQTRADAAVPIVIRLTVGPARRA